MQVRFADTPGDFRRSSSSTATGSVYPEIGGFDGHDGYDGVFFELPGTNAHLEFTRGGHHDDEEAPPPPETLLVLFSAYGGRR